MQTETTNLTLDALEKQFEEITRNMSFQDVEAVQKGLPVREGDNSPKVMKARDAWQKIQTIQNM